METNKGKTILVVEDDQGVLSIIVKHLLHAGFRVITAKDGMEGLKKVKEGGYDLVITDIVMPYVSGAGVLTAAKERDHKIPVIAMTGFGQESESLAIEKKADRVLSKPVTIVELKRHIDDLLRSSRKEYGPQ